MASDTGLQLPVTPEKLTADWQLDSDLTIIAMHAMANAAERVLADGWEFYPELGEYDWQAVHDKIKAAHPFPDHAAYLAAYDRLSARAERSGAVDA